MNEKKRILKIVSDGRLVVPCFSCLLVCLSFFGCVPFSSSSSFSRFVWQLECRIFRVKDSLALAVCGGGGGGGGAGMG